MVEKKYEENLEESFEENLEGNQDETPEEKETNEATEEKKDIDSEINKGEENAEDPKDNEIAKLKQEKDELNQRYLRIAADFDNFRKRTRAEKEELVKYANVNLVSELLPVLDNFERALDVKEPSEEVQKYLMGMEMIFKQLMKILNDAGLEYIEALGKTFDPEKHEAVMRVTDTEVETDTVVEELRKGYAFKDKVIRPSMVKVATKN